MYWLWDLVRMWEVRYSILVCYNVLTYVDTIDENHGLHQRPSLNSWPAPMMLLRWGTLSTKQDNEVKQEGKGRVYYWPHAPPLWTIRLVGEEDDNPEHEMDGEVQEWIQGKTLWILRCKWSSKERTSEFIFSISWKGPNFLYHDFM